MLEKVKEIVADSLGADVSTLTAESSFKEDLGADSLDLFEMVMAFEEEFGREIPTEDLEQLTTIGAVVAYLEICWKSNTRLFREEWHGLQSIILQPLYPKPEVWD